VDFHPDRLTIAGRVVTGGALALLITVFLFKWYGASATSPQTGLTFSRELNGWHTFTSSRWVWLLTALAGLALVAEQGGAFEYEGPVPLDLVVAILGGLSTVLIAYRIIHHPSGAGTVVGSTVTYSFGIKLGIWLAQIAAAAIAYGGWLAMRERGATIPAPWNRAG